MTEANKSAQPLGFGSTDQLGQDDPELDSLHWHALNYRTAHSVHAEAMWVELEAYVERRVAEERERCAMAVRGVAEAYRGTRWAKAAECIGDRCLESIEA